jgi:hypothetical protein
MNDFMWLRGLILAAAILAPRLWAETKYENNFEKAQAGTVPEDLMVLDGAFAVKEAKGNKVLELPGAPLETFGVLFGPSGKENWSVTARIFGAAKGRRYPVFDVGLNGVGGYKLRVSPGKKQLELYRGDALKKAVPLEWKPSKWTHLKLTLAKTGDKEWKVQGKVWQEGSSEPAQPNIEFTDSEAPPAGRASLSGMPYSGQPIWFDDLVVSDAPAK